MNPGKNSPLDINWVIATAQIWGTVQKKYSPEGGGWHIVSGSLCTISMQLLVDAVVNSSMILLLADICQHCFRPIFVNLCFRSVRGQ